MKTSKSLSAIIFFLVFIFTFSCKKETSQQQAKDVEVVTENPALSNLKEALTFYTSFDSGTEADFAGGDASIYSVADRKQRDSAKVGLHKAGVRIAEGEGRFGNALEYTENSKGYIYYKAKNNMNYTTKDWEGAISFWLRLDPAIDLEPGYCDPIQITDSGYNDAGFWVDFTKENPRDFRLGVIGDRDSWNPIPEGPDNENPNFINQLVVVGEMPFSRDAWTHVLINFTGLNSDTGKAAIYINGKQEGIRPTTKDSFTWEIENSNIYLGLGYVGLMDEVSIFKKHLSAEQIMALYGLENGVTTLIE